MLPPYVEHLFKVPGLEHRIEQTEKELRGLQVTCRELFDRTNVYVDSKTPPHLVNGLSNGAASRSDSDDGDTPAGKIGAWIWRAIRAGLPFQLAVLACIYIACYLEPQCCDSVNNFPFSVYAPALRYVKGPPPV